MSTTGNNDLLLCMPQVCVEASRKAGILGPATSASYEDRKCSECFSLGLRPLFGRGIVLP
jgi:hypothetical protein